MAKAGIFFSGSISYGGNATYTPSSTADYAVITVYASAPGCTVGFSGTGLTPASHDFIDLVEGYDPAANTRSLVIKCLVIGAGQTISIGNASGAGNIVISGIEHLA